MADCEVEGTIASPRSIPSERAMSPTGERSDEGRNIRTQQNPLGPQSNCPGWRRIVFTEECRLCVLRATADLSEDVQDNVWTYPDDRMQHRSTII
ncbi:hypothetical protein TNCV_3775281 [Trichonephila clavipes]|nr:hypothetical protein TNCV_3775281 [Trichonephila clavipes]